jgi:ATP-binding cassette subfamily B (MDR/TAP) protein 1
MSGGQKQRLCIARAILKNPKILLLDEATSALDRANELSIQKTLDKVSIGRTTIVVAHRLTTVMNSDKIIVLDYRKIAEVGTHDELIRLGGRYEALAKNQMQGEIDAAFVTIENFLNEDALTPKEKRVTYIRLFDAVQILRADAEKHGKTIEIYFYARYSELKGARLL